MFQQVTIIPYGSELGNGEGGGREGWSGGGRGREGDGNVCFLSPISNIFIRWCVDREGKVHSTLYMQPIP